MFISPNLNMKVTRTVISSTRKIPAMHREYWNWKFTILVFSILEELTPGIPQFNKNYNYSYKLWWSWKQCVYVKAAPLPRCGKKWKWKMFLLTNWSKSLPVKLNQQKMEYTSMNVFNFANWNRSLLVKIIKWKWNY